MNINKINYEEYLVSSLEGLLATEEQASLDAFLHAHPELKKDVDAYKRVFFVPDETITYPDKALLYKHESDKIAAIHPQKRRSSRINIINYEEYMVSSLEGKLTNEEQAALDVFLHEHPDLKSEMDAFKLAFLKPDRTIKYPDKVLLLKPEPRLVPFYRRYSVWMSVAATVLLLLVFRTFLILNDRGSISTPESQAQPGKQNYATSGRFDLPGRQEQEHFISSLGNPNSDNVTINRNNAVAVVNRRDTGHIQQYSTMPVKVTYVSQAQPKPRMAPLPTNAVQFAALRQQAQRNQSLITNAASVGKTLWHLSGRQLPNETQNGQQFHVVQVGYDSKDFSFVKIIH